MSHPFGDLVTQHLSRRHGLSQNKLAAGICQDPAVISAMCNGRRLSGRQARERVLAILGWLHARAVLSTRAEADALLEAAKPGASYTIQILDKVRDTSVDVLHELSLPGEHAIDLVQAMGWQGPQVCTINVWVGGASRAVTFERIAVEVDRTKVR